MAVLMAIGSVRKFHGCRSYNANGPLCPIRRHSSHRCDASVGLWTLLSARSREFFRVYGWLALLMLAMIHFYRLPEFMMGPMANPFYHDLGLSKDVCRHGAGIDRDCLPHYSASPLAVFSALRFGYVRTLSSSASVLQSLVIAAFAHTRLFRSGRSRIRRRDGGRQLRYRLCRRRTRHVYVQPDESWLHGDAVRAPQSAYTYVGKFAKGFSGVIVERLAVGAARSSRPTGLFFIFAGLLGLPALVLCVFLARAGTPAVAGRGRGASSCGAVGLATMQERRPGLSS